MKAVIFDLDGTLLDTETISTQALQKVVDPLGKTIDWDLKRKLLGLPAKKWTQIVINELELSESSELTWEQMAQGWETNLNSLLPTITAMPGALEITQIIASKNNPRIVQGIATSSNSHAVTVKRTHHDPLFQHMKVVVCGDDPQLQNGKPDPQIYTLAMERLGITDPSTCLVFEDSPAGVQSAKAAGMNVIAVPDPRLAQLNDFTIADEVIPSLKHFDFDKWGIAHS